MSSPTVSVTLLHFLRLFNASLSTFSFSYPPSYPSSLSDLSDGVYLYRLLHTLDPTHFDLDGLDPSPSPDSVQDNLHHLLVSVETFMEDVSGGGKGVDVSAEVDFDRMAEEDVVHLIEVVVLCAVNSGEREGVIHRVMGMTEREQEQLMGVIHSCMERLHFPVQPHTVGGTPGRLSDVSADSNDPRSPSSAMNSSFSLPSPPIPSTPKGGAETQRLTALEREVTRLERREAEQAEEVRILRAEKERERLRGVEEGQQEKELEWSDRLQKAQQRHSRDIAELQHRMTEVSASLHQHQRIHLALEKEKVALLSSLEDCRVRLQQADDDLQVAQTKADQVGQLEAKVARLTAMLSSVGDMKAQAEYSEEEARKSVDRIVQLEREVKEVATVKAALSRMKEALIRKEEEGLEWKLREEELKAQVDEAKDGLKERERRVKEAEEENRRLKEELKEAKSKETAVGGGGFEMIVGPPTPTSTLRERIRRVEAENEDLRLRLRGSDGSNPDGASLSSSSSSTPAYSESEVDVLRSIAKSNETKYLEAMRRVSQLERAAQRTARPLSTPTEQTEEIERLHRQLDDLHFQLQRQPQGIPSTASLASPSVSTDVAVKKLRKYAELWKAASKKVAMYRTREEEWKKEGTAMKEQISRLKEVIGEREREVEVREKVRVEEMAVSLRERRIMQAAFYNLGTEWANTLVLGRAAGKGGSDKPAGARAWLAQQRAKAME